MKTTERTLNTRCWMIARKDALTKGEYDCFLKVCRHIGGGFMRVTADRLTPLGASPFRTKEEAVAMIPMLKDMMYDDFGQYETVPAHDVSNYIAVEIESSHKIFVPTEDGEE